MLEADLFKIYLKRLNDSTVSYMITGSVASIIYGKPRLTHDIDIVLELNYNQIDAFLKVFPEAEFYRPPAEVIQTEIMRETRGHFNIIHHDSGFKADIYTIGRDQLHRWAMDKRRSIDFNKMKIWVAPPEYVILRKLEFFKEGGSDKHIRDIKSIMESSSDVIDRELLKAKAIDIGILDLLNKFFRNDLT